MPVLIARDQVKEPLYAIVPYFNPWRHKSRDKHTQRALRHFHDSGAVIVLVEAGFNRRELVYADSGLNGTASECGILGTDHRFRHRYIGLHTKDELWLKENLINIGVQNLPYDWQQVCWLDSDVHFVRPNWTGECIHKLQHYHFLQMFSQARDLSPNFEMLPEDYPHANGVSFLRSWMDGDLEDNLVRRVSKEVKPKAKVNDEGNYYGARRVFPGLAWACTRPAFDWIGGLVDFAIWGGADWSMSHALIGKRDSMMHTRLHDNYKNMMNAWADRADKHIRRNVGVMEGAIFHNWHGKKTVRGYGDKHRILAELAFDPMLHLKRDSAGLWQLHDDGTDAYIKLRDSFRRIARERNEDSIDV
jgi:hypothetical protein